MAKNKDILKKKPESLSNMALKAERGITIVVKSNDLNEARYQMSLREQKLFLYMISLVNPNDNPQDNPTYGFYLTEVLDIIYSKGKNLHSHYSHFKRIVKGLHKISLEFVNKKGKYETFSLVHLLEKVYVEQNTGLVQFTIPGDLIEHLFNLKTKFIQYNFENISSLRSIYSIRMYELLKQYQRLGYRKFTIEQFREQLKLEGKYSEYKTLKKWVILVAQKELKISTDIYFDFKEHKTGRKVIEITFYVKKNKNVNIEPIPNPDKPTLFDNTIIDVEAKIVKTSLPIEIMKLLATIGIKEKVAENLYLYALDNCDHQNLIALFEEKVSIYKKQSKKSKISNPSGFLRKALYEDYKDEILPKEQEKAERLKKEKEKEEKTKNLIEKRRSILMKAYSEEKPIIDTFSTAIPTLYQSFYEAMCSHRFVKPYKNKISELKSHLEENYTHGNKEFWLLFRRYVKEMYPLPFESINEKYAPVIKKIDEELRQVSE